MNKRQQQKFIYFFDELCEAEEAIDKLKVDLLHRTDFNPHLLFERLSQGNQSIFIHKLKNYLSDRLPCSDRQLYEIFEKFDSERNGYITRKDFLRQLTPFSRLANPPHYHQNQGVLNSQIQSSFLQIIIEQLKRFRIIEEARKEVAFIQPWEAFQHLDTWKKGIIGLGDLVKFYKDNDFQTEKSSLEFLLHALRRRYHRDVTLELFCQTLNPLEFGEYAKFSAQMSKHNQKQFLKRSRIEEESAKQSRVENQLLEYQIQRAQRRKKAEIQRQIEMSERINRELLSYDKHQYDIIRKKLLEEERQIRKINLASNSMLNQINYPRTAESSRRFYQEELIRERAQDLGAQKQRSLIGDEIAIQQQIQRQHQAQRLLSQAKKEQLRSRELDQINLLKKKQLELREFERERLLQNYPEVSLPRVIRKNRVEELEAELQQTRAQMRERRQRLQKEEKLRLLETAAKSQVSSSFLY